MKPKVEADYKCQGDSDDMQWSVMHVFRKQDGKIFHFRGTKVLDIWLCRITVLARIAKWPSGEMNLILNQAQS